MTSKVLEAWESVTSNLPDRSNDWWAKLSEKYEADGRSYHNIDHLTEKLEHFENVKRDLKNPSAVCLAIFFQYFYYDPKEVDCEEKNIEFFKQFADECNIPQESPLHGEVVRLLRGAATNSTEEHKTEGAHGTDDLHYLLDVDMAILGAPEDRYSEYARRVRQEYAFLSDSIYNQLRVKVLQNFLQIPNIFATKIFREKFEKQARLNIQREVDGLKPQN
ncbi:uncharacterized protein LOC134527575 [Bacillus rossius redtenbacheri]|uniref:uncharacterized protein LOC134527575 n=1 Tax=Bacillus rossius redtenbacheri TaxID=93214 RepID=UPI002FDD5256